MFKIYCNVIFFFLINVSIVAQINKKEGYQIKVKIENYTKDSLSLAYHLGSKSYISQTIYTKDKSSDGSFVFQKDTLLHPGVYMIVTHPDNAYFEFLIPNDKEQQFEIFTKFGDDLISNLVAKGSFENETFFSYLKFINEKKQTNNIISDKLKNAESAEKAQLNNKLSQLDQEVKSYQENLIKKYPNTLFSALIKSTLEPEIPDAIKAKGNNDAFYYYREQFWNSIDFNQRGLLYTPILESKLDRYLENLTVQNPDSIIYNVDILMNKVLKKGNKEIHQFFISNILNKYAKSKVVCMDKVYVHVGSKYYCASIQPDWIEKDQLNKICENVNKLQFSQCGNFAPQISLKNFTNNENVNLYGIEANYTIIYFGDFKNQSLENDLKSLENIYKNWKSNGVEILSVCSNADINNNEINQKLKNIGSSFFNVYGEKYVVNKILELYDVKSFPSLYLLNDKKIILYKRIGINQIDEILKSLIK